MVKTFSPSLTDLACLRPKLEKTSTGNKFFKIPWGFYYESWC